MLGEALVIPAGRERKTKARDHVVKTRDDRNDLLISGRLENVHMERAVDLVGAVQVLARRLLGRQLPKLLLEFIQHMFRNSVSV